MLRLKEPVGEIRYHMSGQLNGALLGFTESIADGENWFSILNTKKPQYYHVMTLPMFRAQYAGHNFGPVSAWLPQPTRAFGYYMKAHGKKITDIYPDPDRESRWIVGMVLLHNSGLWPAYIPGDWQDLRHAMQDYRLSNARYAFLPYWEQSLVRTEPANEDLVVSIYRSRSEGPRGPLQGGKDAANNDSVVALPERALLVVFNNTEWDGDARLHIDWQALGLDPDGITVENPAFGEAVRNENADVIVPITRRDVRLVGVKGRG
jgi:hypothetical protein